MNYLKAALAGVVVIWGVVLSAVLLAGFIILANTHPLVGFPILVTGIGAVIGLISNW